MNILIVSYWDFPHVGGISTHIELLRRGLTRQGHHVHIFSMSTAQRMATHVEVSVRPRVREIPLHFSSPFLQRYESNRILFEEVARRINYAQYDVVHAHDAVSAEIVGRLADLPLLLTLHGYLARETLSEGLIWPDSREEQYLLTIEHQALIHAREVIAVDSLIRDYLLEQGTPERRLTVFRNFVDIHQIAPSSRAEIRAQLSVPNDAFLVICPRRLVDKNGVIYAIQAMEELRKEVPTAILVCLGDGAKRQSLIDYIQGRGIGEFCRLPGATDNETVVRCIQAADAVVIPSVPSAGVQEATSIAAIEAMAVGAPVVASSIGGLKELITNGVTGWLSEPGNPSSIAGALASIAKSQEWRKIALRARRHVASHHSLKEAVHRLEEIYERMSS